MEVVSCSSLHSLRSVVLTTEALPIDIVVVVLSVVRHLKGFVVILDDLLLEGILRVVIDRDSITHRSCIRDTPRILTIACQVTQLTYDTLATDVDMLRVATALAGYHIIDVESTDDHHLIIIFRCTI